MAKETAGGVGLLGFDVPAIVSAEEDHLRVIAAVECRDAAALFGVLYECSPRLLLGKSCRVANYKEAVL